MNHTSDAASNIETLNFTKRDIAFTDEVISRSGVNIYKCWHCRSCTGGCPFVHAMVHPPNQLIRMAQLGLRKESLESSGSWICVSCNTCSVQCPNGIDIPAVNDALRQMAIEAGVAVPEPNILNFHRAVLRSIERHGRTHKLEVMLRYKLKTRDWFGDLALGIKMFARRKLEILPSKSTHRRDIKRFFVKKTEA